MPQLDSNGTARVGGGHRGVTEIVRSLESTRNGPDRSRVEPIQLSSFARALRSHTAAAVPILVRAFAGLPRKPRV